MSVGRICVREVDTAEAHESVQTAANRMNDRNVGSLLVLGAKGQPVGIVTDRDLTVRVLAKGLDGIDTTVGEVMTPFPQTVYEDTPIEEALRIMRSGPYRRLPVVNPEGKLVGVLSIDDILDLLAEEFEAIGRLLRAERPEALAGS
jgi:CBS domain-containing protein